MKLLVIGWVFLVNLVMIAPDGIAQSSRAQFIYDFETNATLPEFFEFQTEYEIFENPDQSGINTSLLVGRISKIKGNSIGWSGIAMINQPKVNLYNGGYLKMKVFATTKMGTVQVKLETDPRSQQAYGLAEVTKLNEWEELEFHYKAGGTIDYARIVIIFDLGSVEDHTYFFDDITWVNGKSEAN